jgi:cyclic pyranopterin phosphate synthase
VSEIQSVALAAVELGFRKFRLTGGEPLVREAIGEIVAALSAIDGVEDLAMTTNGVFLVGKASSLAAAGLHRVNVSLDTMDPQRYAEITGRHALEKVLAGIEAARAAGLEPVKLNCVVKHSADEPDARDVAAFAAREGLQVRFIREMNLSTGAFWVVQGGAGGDCPRCNRIRLTCDGHLKPCLFSDLAFDVRELGPVEALRLAIEAKPASGHACREHDFCAVGG